MPFTPHKSVLIVMLNEGRKALPAIYLLGQLFQRCFWVRSVFKRAPALCLLIETSATCCG